MNIFFDHQVFTLQKYGDISRYFCELITGINETDHNKAHLSLLWSNNIHLKEYNIPTFSYPFPKRHRLLFKTNETYNIVETKFKQYDIYHATYFNDFLSNHIFSRPYVTTFYDMIYERLSSQFIELSSDKLIIDQKRKIAQRASHLIAISENTKRDMVDLLDINPEKITVIHLSSPFENFINQKKLNSVTTDRPYLLFVGNRAGYKNFTPFLQAIANILVRYQIRLICAGGGKFTIQEHDLIRTLSVNHLVEQQAINDTILPNLYSDAIAFVFPSMYEGFGIPVLEAFSCNCPCIVSNTSSLPEVAGEAALYFDPVDLESMANAVEKLILDNELGNLLINRGQKQLLKFSRQSTIDKTLDLYKKLV